ncbi:SRPBCC domain-containing protein [Larkinella soli]|uniref:SRPBCC domain-containing protein n=1 Tax=Larkinella soli TaxID=1770527 RepID=UPI000FFB17B0|nr:SRPBCC domain-containing protein [Larkinella soli]
MIIRNEIILNADPATVWNLLTNPEKTKQYMYGCEVVTDWKVGSPIEWKGEYEGKETVFVTGNIVRLEPGELLAYTVIDPHGPYPEDVSSPLTVVCEVIRDDDKTVLLVSQGDYSRVTDGEDRYRKALAEGGWDGVLCAIRDLLEREKA